MRCDLRRQQKMERGGAAVTCDGRLFHRRAAVTGNALSPTVDRRVRPNPDSLMRQNVVVIWLQCLLVDVVLAVFCRDVASTIIHTRTY